mmetsp:Transcript_7253/g.15698  ORF Transcript_7253/g.15698 Transcript_7253/m.15698 type:complete len:253 (+) Transcript_7253:76-834(+)
MAQLDKASLERVELDEVVLERVLAFTFEVSARACCRSWARYLFDSLQLEYCIKFHKLVRQQSKVSYHHCSVRAYGEDFQECVAYQFEFADTGTYHLQWNRSFGQWSAANERQLGRWQVVGNQLRCESGPGPEVDELAVRYAPAGRVFELPVATACSGRFDGEDSPSPWEYQIRGTPAPAMENSFITGSTGFVGEATQGDVRGQSIGDSHTAESRYLEIDGEVHEVSGDIMKNYPESDWPRLMRCRVRFGLGN